MIALLIFFIKPDARKTLNKKILQLFCRQILRTTERGMRAKYASTQVLSLLLLQFKDLIWLISLFYGTLILHKYKVSNSLSSPILKPAQLMSFGVKRNSSPGRAFLNSTIIVFLS